LKKKFRSFINARSFVQKLGIKGDSEWRRYCKSSKKPEDIPKTPWRVYKTTGWKNYGDWLGTGYVANQKRKYRSIKEATELASSLNFKSREDWNAYCKSSKKPEDIPATPQRVYKNKEWISWDVFLGTGRVADNLKKFRSFEVVLLLFLETMLDLLFLEDQTCQCNNHHQGLDHLIFFLSIFFILLKTFSCE